MVNAAEINPRESLSGLQSFFLLFLRVVIGWHFLYEGVVKIGSEGWTAAGYLRNVPGPFAGIFETMISSPAMATFVDAVMKYGLTAIGLLLILGLFTRVAAIGAARPSAAVLPVESAMDRGAFHGRRGKLPYSEQEPGRDGCRPGFGGFPLRPDPGSGPAVLQGMIF